MIDRYLGPAVRATKPTYDPRDDDQGPHEFTPGSGVSGLGQGETGPLGIHERRPGETWAPGVEPTGSRLYPIDQRYPGQQPYDITNPEGIDRTNEPNARNHIYGAPPPAPLTPLRPTENVRQADQAQIEQSMYRQPYVGSKADQPDEVHSTIMEYQRHEQMTPDQRRSEWIEQNIWKQGLTVDMGTNEIIDPDTGQAVGQLPDFR